ncbi:MAG: hypothetical protein O7F73_07555 [Gammaproteobacteria bacterium]|nr:hypothetical protein [Gammaproteobacteria bacterium]
MGTDSIRKIIAAARLQEQQSGDLRQFFSRHLPKLRERLLLPEENAALHLVSFVEQYIEYVPVFIDSVTSISRELGVYPYVSPFLHMAEDYFLAPPDELEQEVGLRGLLDAAFLAQRLIEEVNDCHIRHYRAPLLPVDMTRANVIVHHLIGDQLANRLDGLVEHTAQRLVDREHLFEQGRELPEQMAPDRWQDLPCLSRNAEVDLRLASPAHFRSQSS